MARLLLFHSTSLFHFATSIELQLFVSPTHISNGLSIEPSADLTNFRTYVSQDLGILLHHEKSTILPVSMDTVTKLSRKLLQLFKILFTDAKRETALLGHSVCHG